MVVLSCEGVACFPARSDAFCEYAHRPQWSPGHCTTRRKDKEVEAAAGMLVKTGGRLSDRCAGALLFFFFFPNMQTRRRSSDPPSTAAPGMKASGPDAASVASPVMFISLVPLVLSRPPSFSSADQYRRHTGSLSDRVSILHTIRLLSCKALPSTRLIVARLIVSQS